MCHKRCSWFVLGSADLWRCLFNSKAFFLLCFPFITSRWHLHIKRDSPGIRRNPETPGLPFHETLCNKTIKDWRYRTMIHLEQPVLPGYMGWSEQNPTDTTQTSPRHLHNNIPKTSSRCFQIILNIFPRSLSPRCPPNYLQDIPKISPKYPPNYPQYIPKIYPRYPPNYPQDVPQYIPKISPRYPQDILQISSKLSSRYLLKYPGSGVTNGHARLPQTNLPFRCFGFGCHSISY